jgi:hypothetical protein
LGYVFNGTALTTINDPLAIGGTTTVLGINNLGEVVGNWKDSNFNTGGFTYDAVNNIFINDNIGVPATYVAPSFNGINDHGQLVGSYNGATGGGIGFVATPVSAVPLPGAVWLFGLALMARLYSDKRRKALLTA